MVQSEDAVVILYKFSGLLEKPHFPEVLKRHHEERQHGPKLTKRSFPCPASTEVESIYLEHGISFAEKLTNIVGDLVFMLVINKGLYLAGVCARLKEKTGDGYLNFHVLNPTVSGM